MKNTTKKLLAAVMTALLVAVAFVGVAAADMKISVDKTGMDNLSQISATDYTGYWTVIGSDIVIPFNVTGDDSNNQTLAGYVVTFAGNLTDKSHGGISYENASSTWTAGSLAINGKTIAKAVDAGDIMDIRGGNQTFKVVVKNLANPGSSGASDTGLYGYYGVNLTNLEGNFSTSDKTSYTDISSYTNMKPAVTASLDSGNGFFYNNEFVFAVRDTLNTTKFYFPDYITEVTDFDATPGVVYIYREHENAQNPAGSVNVTAILNHTLDTTYDTQKWTVTSGAFGSVDTAGTVVGKNLTNSLSNMGTLATKTETKESTLNLTLNEAVPFARNVSEITVNLSNWNTVAENNTQAFTAGKALSTEKWSFVTPLMANYTIRAGPVNTTVSSYGWNTSVLFENISVNNQNYLWKPNVTVNTSAGGSVDNYKFYGLNAVDGTEQLASNQYFNVTENGIKDGAKTLIIHMVGYKVGDANLDSNVDIVDSAVVGITILKGAGSAAGIEFLPIENRLYADCEKTPDGSINVADILAINKYIVGLDPWSA